MQDSPSFNFVLVDGNKFPVPEELIRQGYQGGLITAIRLRSIVEDSLRRSGFDLSLYARTRIVLFANLASLTRDYRRSRSTIRSFVSGFDKTDLLTAFHEVDQTFVSRKDLEGEYSTCDTLTIFHTDLCDSNSNAHSSLLQSLFSQRRLSWIQLGRFQVILQSFDTSEADGNTVEGSNYCTFEASI